MAKKSTPPPASARQAKIQAAQKSQGSGANKIVVAAVVAVVAIIVVVVGVIWMEQSKTNEVTGGGNALPTGVSALGAGYPAFQDVTPAANAPTVDIYEDFQCPACASFEAALGSTFQGWPRTGKIKLVYHVKNFLDDNLRNDSSTRAANAAFCASDAGKFQEFHNTIFPNQPANEGDGYTDAQLKAFAEQAGVTGDAADHLADLLRRRQVRRLRQLGRGGRASPTASRAPRPCGSTARTSTCRPSRPRSC